MDPTTSSLYPGDAIAPFYFGASKFEETSFARYTTAIAVIRPEEAGRASLSEGWGAWADADIIWEMP